MTETLLNLVVIRSADMPKAAQFYQMLGLTFDKHRHGSGPEHFVCERGGIVFEIYPRKDETDATMAARLGFRVLSVDGIVEKLRQAGAEIVSAPKDSPWGRRAVVADPDGHRVELVEPVPDGGH